MSLCIGHLYTVTYTRSHIDTINSPDYGHTAAQNMWRIKINIHEKELCIQLVIYKDDYSNSFIHSFHWHVQNATIPCRSQELLPFLSVMYPFLPPFSTN